MDTRDPLKYYSTLCVDILSIMSLSPAWTARPSGALSGQPSAPSVSVPCHSNTIMLHYTKQQSRAMEPGACTIYFLFCLLLSACSRKTLYLRTVVIQLHRHQLGCSHHDGDRTFIFLKYQFHTFLPYLMVSCFFRFYQYLFRYYTISICVHHIIINYCQKNLQCTLFQLA